MPAISPVTHGVTHGTAAVGEFRLTETSHGPHTRLERHRHAHPAVTFVLRGGFVEDFGVGRSLACAAMSVLVKPADAAHTNRYSSDGARSFILECASASAYAPALDARMPGFAPVRLVVPMLELYAGFARGHPSSESCPKRSRSRLQGSNEDVLTGAPPADHRGSPTWPSASRRLARSRSA